MHAETLGRRAIPAALKTHDPVKLEATLQLAQSCKTMVAAGDLEPLLAHHQPRIRALAIGLLPSAEGFDDLEGALRQGLLDDSDDVRATAALTAGRLRCTPVAPMLSRCLSGDGARSPLAAAWALAECGPAGLRSLEVLARGEYSPVVMRATEVIEKARIGRLRFATL